MHKESIRDQALKLRKDGFSYSYISKKTGLSKSTLSDWLTDVLYSPNTEMIEILGNARAASTKRKAQIRQEEMKQIRREAVGEIGTLTKRDVLIFGLGLYMGEGNKTNSLVSVANSDPRVMKAVVAWLSSLGVRKAQLSARIFLYPDSNIEESLNFWSKATSIPLEQFHRSYIDQRIDKKLKKKGKLPFGTLHIRVRSEGRKEYGVLFSRKIQALNEAILSEI